MSVTISLICSIIMLTSVIILSVELCRVRTDRNNLRMKLGSAQEKVEIAENRYFELKYGVNNTDNDKKSRNEDSKKLKKLQDKISKLPIDMQNYINQID